MSMYSTSVPVFIHVLTNLSAILEIGEAYARDRKIDEAVMTSLRLTADMFPLSRQVQIASDVAKGGGARLAGMESPGFEDNETTFAELQSRIQRTIAFLEGLSADDFQGAEDRTIAFKAGPYELTFKGDAFLTRWALPNLYFHVTTAYNILRDNGVQLGKMDYLGSVQ
ncbi:MAG: DUF1993 domain-containing protein [Pseudohongiellaceae bacterium]